MPDFRIAPHFTYYEATNTARAALLQANRQAGLAVLPKLVLLYGGLLEPLREKLGALHSSNGYRCPALNAAVGGSPRSQHLRGEAADFWPVRANRDGRQMRQAYSSAIAVLRNRGLMFGQFIFEEKADAAGPYYWLHLSLGAPFRPLAACGQLLDYKAGQGYTRTGTVAFPAWR